MAANAHILVTADTARTESVFQRLSTIPGALVHEFLGPDAVVIDLEADTPEDIIAILRHKIRPIHGIINAVTVESPA